MFLYIQALLQAFFYFYLFEFANRKERCVYKSEFIKEKKISKRESKILNTVAACLN